MGTGWRRAFCTSIRRDPETAASTTTTEKQSPSPSPRSFAKLSLFSGGGDSSNPSTPRLPPSQPVVNSPSLRCRTKSPPPPESPKLQCKMVAAETKPYNPPTTTSTRSPRLFQASSNPSSPRSPSRFALLKATLRLTRTRCGICVQSVKTGQGSAIFTAECSHAFHFPCIAAHVRIHGSLLCPVCSATWRQVPLLSSVHGGTPPSVQAGDEGTQQSRQEDLEQGKKVGERVVAEYKRLLRRRSNTNEVEEVKAAVGRGAGGQGESKEAAATKVYNDDEPLLSPTGSCGPRFNPIPEADDEDEQDVEVEGENEGEGGEFQGFFVANPSPFKSKSKSSGEHRQKISAVGEPMATSLRPGLEVSLMPEAALVSAGRSYLNYVVALKVKAPPPPPPPRATGRSCSSSSTVSAPLLLDPSRRAPIDLVTVLNVSGSMTGAKLHMLKRAMRLLISSLGPTDRLSIVAFSAAAKRLLPLRRMSPQGQRSARHIVDRLVCGQGTCVGDALRKATKVLEDRRDRNPVASIMLLSDGQQQQQQLLQEDDKDGSSRSGSRSSSNRRRPSSVAAALSSSAAAPTRFAHLEIPIHASGFGDGQMQMQSHEPAEDAFAKCVGGLLSVVLQDVRFQLVFPSGEVSAVYSCSDSGRSAVLGDGGSIRLGDLYAEEERELLVELRVPAAAVAGVGAQTENHQSLSMSVKCSYRDPATQELFRCGDLALLLPPLRDHHHHPQLRRSSSSLSLSSTPTPKIERLRNLFVTTRAVAESRRLADINDFATALHLLSSARSLLLQSTSSISAADENLRGLEAELADLQWRRQQQQQNQNQNQNLQQHHHENHQSSDRRRRGDPRELPMPAGDDGGEPLTPTSAWRAAERLAKVAIMRKSLNRVSDLHGFENARF